MAFRGLGRPIAINTRRRAFASGTTNSASAYAPSLPNHPVAHQIPAIKAFQEVAVNSASPRLSSRAPLHGLIRLGHKHQAFDLAVSIGAGRNLRTKTFMHTLTPPQPFLPRRVDIPAFLTTPNPRRLADIVATAQHPDSRLALEDFAVAWKTRQNDARGMLGTVITVCLTNSEIILASVIFAFVVTEFQHRSAWQLPRSETYRTLKELAQSIKRNFETSKQNTETLGASLQALANLASLVDNRQLPIRDISPLLHVLYLCPHVDANVWIIEINGNTKQVKAYTYIHDVLERLITTLPTAPTPSSSPSMLNSRSTSMPPIDLHACNTLLHYSLRHRRSPAFAGIILKHMVEERSPPLQPDSTTSNILLRSGTLMRDSAIAQKAIAAHQLTLSDNHSNTAASVSIDELHDSTIIALCQSLRSVDLTLPTSRADITRLLYSLTTHLMHYTATGRPELASKHLFTLFPELAATLPPMTSNNTDIDITRDKKALRKMVVRASKYGPMIFAVLLNAFSKSGRSGGRQVKALWGLAQQAERHSWKGLNPWVLGVEAYTCMMRCWEWEYRRGVKKQREEVQAMAMRGGMQCYCDMKDVREKVQRVLAEIGREYRMERVGSTPDVDAGFVKAALALFMQPHPAEQCQNTGSRATGAAMYQLEPGTRK